MLKVEVQAGRRAFDIEQKRVLRTVSSACILLLGL
jgi:hypothetical protein